MSKVILWLVIIFAVLFVLRLMNAAKAKRRREATRARDPNAERVTGAMVRCKQCGVFLPKADALPSPVDSCAAMPARTGVNLSSAL